MPDLLAPQRFAVNGTTYEACRWEFTDGRLWSDRLMLLLGRMAKGANTDPDAAIARLLEELDEQLLSDFWAVALKYTNLVGMHEGREAVVPLADVAAIHMKGRYVDYLRIRQEHLTREFAPFFAEVGVMLKELFPKQKGSAG